MTAPPQDRDDADVPQPMRDIFRRYLGVGCTEGLVTLRDMLGRPENRERAEAFMAQLRAAIEGSILTPESYEVLTGEDFDSPEDLRAWLQHLSEELSQQM